MEIPTIVSLITVVGLAFIIQAFEILMYRVGDFSLQPGESGRLIRRTAILLAMAVAFPFVLKLIPSRDAFLIILSIAFIAYLLLTRGRRARQFQQRPAEERAELERRVAFMRSRPGVGLLVAMMISLIIWTIGVVVIWAAMR
jgi:hypothetical protein